MAMKSFFFSFFMLVAVAVIAQQERDTVYKRCPLYITDTATSNNFFLEALPATVKVDRIKGGLTIAIQQKDQLFSMFFNERKLKNGKFKIEPNGGKNREVIAKYSFGSAGQVSFVNVSKGTVESLFDKEKDLWHIKVNGTIINMVERSVTYYRVKADFFIY
jgi:hypothetical protein